MSDEVDDPILEDRRTFVAAFVAFEQPGPAAKRSMWRGIQGRTAPRGGAKHTWWVAGLSAAAAIVVGMWWAGSVAQRDRLLDLQQGIYAQDGSPAPKSAVAVPGVPAEVSPVASEDEIRPLPPVSPAQVPAQVPSPTSAGRNSSTRPAKVVEAVTPRASDLARENELFSEIHQALRRGRPDRALELLAAHAERFPRGVFRLERRLLKVRALCAAGRKPEAVAAAKAFIAEHPKSHLVAQFKTICEP